MLVYKAYRYRLYPTEEQKDSIEKTICAYRFVWNAILERMKKMFERRGETLTLYSAITIVDHMKEYLPWLASVGSYAPRFAVKNLMRAREDFYRRVKAGKKPGYPKFKDKKNPIQRYTTDGIIRVTNSYVQIPKIGRIRYKHGRLAEGKPYQATISRDKLGRYWVSVNCKVEVEPMPKVENCVGVDVGLKTFATDSNGVKYPNPRYHQQLLKRLAHEQRKFARQTKGSNNWRKQKNKIAKIYEKIRNQRADYHHKLSRKLVNENQVIVLEKLNINGMLKSHKGSFYVADAAWGDFIDKVKYKAEWASRVFVQVSQWFPSSQLCSNCGYKNTELRNLNIRKWTCPICGAHHDRDINAAKNILIEGLRILAEAQTETFDI